MTLAQQTYVPDDNFEANLEANGMGNGIANDDYVTTANINLVSTLYVSYDSISDLTGIEDFTSLTRLFCHGNQLTSLDVSNNTALYFLYCYYNQLTSLDVSGAIALYYLVCDDNQLTSLDVSNNTNLTGLWCLDNQLTSLDLRNGNNANIDTSFLNLTNNPQLYCINVDNPVWSTTNWTVAKGNIDPQQYFSNNCSGTSVEEHTTNKELLRTIDILGRETKNNPLFYIYDDGTVEKRIIIE
jgi:Leucine-rich repeat (LRR) protein